MSNSDLARLWELACRGSHWDEAWRVASVRLSRQSMGRGGPPLQAIWRFSGEQPAVLAFQSLQVSDVEACLQGFAADQTLLIWALLRVGPFIPNLLVDTQPWLMPAAYRLAPAESLKGRAQRLVEASAWLFRLSAKDYLLLDPHPWGQGETSSEWRALEFFFRRCQDFTVKETAWGQLFAVLFHQLRGGAWGWRLSVLRDVFDQLRSPAQGQRRMRSSEEVVNPLARFLTQLDSDQRRALYDLTPLVRSMDDVRAVHGILGFVARLTTVLCQRHLEGLESLQAWQAPLPVIRGFEAWLVGQPYSQWRQTRGLVHQMPVPESLRCAGTLE